MSTSYVVDLDGYRKKFRSRSEAEEFAQRELDYAESKGDYMSTRHYKPHPDVDCMTYEVKRRIGEWDREILFTGFQAIIAEED